MSLSKFFVHFLLSFGGVLGRSVLKSWNEHNHKAERKLLPYRIIFLSKALQKNFMNVATMLKQQNKLSLKMIKDRRILTDSSKTDKGAYKHLDLPQFLATCSKCRI